MPVATTVSDFTRTVNKETIYNNEFYNDRYLAKRYKTWIVKLQIEQY